MAFSLIQQQPRLENTKPLSHTAEPYNPTLTTTPNILLHLHPLYQQPPPPPSPSVMVTGMPVEGGVWCYLDGNLYHQQHVYHHHHHHLYYQLPPPLLPKLEYAGFEVYNPRLFLRPQPSQPIKSTSVVLEEVVVDDDDVRVAMTEKVVKKITGGFGCGGGGGGRRKVGGMVVKKVEKSYCEKRAKCQGVWLPKKIDCSKPDHHHVLSQGETTVMLRNIPNKLRRDQLLEILDNHCREENDEGKNGSDHVRSAYDFVYLPIDFKRLGNKGYAFINFTTGEGAARLRKAMNRRKWHAYLESQKQCGFSVARIQGRQALVKHFESSKFPTRTESFLPVVLLPARDGSYPPSTPRVVGSCV